MWDQGQVSRGFDVQGGGFSSPGGFGTPQGEERKGRTRAQSLVPCTVAQVLNATHDEDKFYSGSLQISQVTLVGLIRSVKESTTRIDYELDDMTGPLIEIKQFVGGDEEEKAPTMRENTYVRVYGHVRSFAGKISVVAFKIFSLEDINELTCHILEVIYCHASASKNPLASGSNQANTVRAGSSAALVGEYNSGNSYGLGLSSLHQQIAMVIKNNTTPSGASIEEITRHIKGSEKAIRDAIEFLSSEGHIYSTIDDDHFKTTDG